ncbi:hypothetical protein HELRODRAFT_179448 [Helobdella robusta]|uniref:Uncharacterized protein n=1 Tax=Helobdella robusta TaxID=6412 RepID=T1FEQ4_HELRO|nr:hypothetical protein HELRODRAFT_179448 [Helobdella robusta]ESN95379.1 hypothetical protein HELRODRAFT_179448 [Helobdella robusta]
MDCEPAGTDHQQHINDNNGEDDDDDDSTNFEAVVRVMQQAHDEGYALFRTALNCGSKRNCRRGRGEGVGVSISNDDEDAAAVAAAAADDEEQHRHELCESYMNVQKKYDNIIRDLLFKNNKLIEVCIFPVV